MNKFLRWLIMAEEEKECKYCKAKMEKKWKACPTCGMPVGEIKMPQQVVMPIGGTPIYYPPIAKPPAVAPKNGNTKKKKEISFSGAVFILLMIIGIIWFVTKLNKANIIDYADNQNVVNQGVTIYKTPQQQFSTSFLIDDSNKLERKAKEDSNNLTLNGLPIRQTWHWEMRNGVKTRIYSMPLW